MLDTRLQATWRYVNSDRSICKRRWKIGTRDLHDFVCREFFRDSMQQIFHIHLIVTDSAGTGPVSNVKTVLLRPFQVLRVARCRFARSAIPAPGDSVNVVRIGQFFRKSVEDMCCNSKPRQQYEWTALYTPIQHFQRHPRFDRYELHAVSRWVLPSPGYLSIYSGTYDHTQQTSQSTHQGLYMGHHSSGFDDP